MGQRFTDILLHSSGVLGSTSGLGLSSGGETQSLPFGGDIRDVGKKDVQDILLVAKNKICQRDAEANHGCQTLSRSLDGVLLAVVA